MFLMKVTCLYRLCLNKIKQKINSSVANMMFVQEKSIISVVSKRCQQVSASVSSCQKLSEVVSRFQQLPACVSRCQQLAAIGSSWRQQVASVAGSRLQSRAVSRQLATGVTVSGSWWQVAAGGSIPTFRTCCI